LNGFDEFFGTLTLSGGHITSGAGTLTLLSDVTVNANANTFARIDGNVALSGTRTFTVGDGAFSPDLQINASISGAGGLTKNGSGELSLTASNSYAGLTTINAGSLDVFDSSALGAASVGTILANGAVLALDGGVHVTAEPLTLNGSGNGTFAVLSGSFGSNSWDGPIGLGSDANVSATSASDFLNLAGAISGAGNVSKNGPGTVIFSGGFPNTYDGTTFANDGTLLLAKSVSDGAIPGALTIGNGGAPLSDIVRLVGGQQIADSANVTINSSGWLDLNGVAEGIGTLSGTGRVDLWSGALILNGNSNATYSGVIGGTTGFLSKNGTGTFTLAGTNTYPGSTFINSGTLVVNGSQPASTITVGASGTLGGTGVVGNVISVGGRVSPGTSPGILTSSNVAFDAGTVFNIELNGPNAGSDYDQLNVRGTNNLGGAQLAVQMGNGFVPMEGQQFTILNNDGVDAIVGTFAGLPNNSIVTAANGLRLQIRYSDAFNNDVILTATNLIARIANTTIAGGNGNSGVDANECNFLSVALTNVTGATLSGLTATLVSKTPGVSVTYGTVNYSNIAAGAIGTNVIPFQFTTSPAFGCGNIQFDFLLNTPANGAITVPLSFPSGSPGASIGFSNNTAAAIPDLGVTNSTVTVSGITSTIASVTVSLNIAHTFDSDLSITLIGPDGTAIDLSSNNGGNFDNYGSNCTQRTTFSDAAATSITAGTAPFFGTFRPEQPLATFIGKSGTNVNGTWTLRVADGAAGDTGTLNCWSLFIAPAICGDGGGGCESCPENWIITGQLGSGSLTQTGRLIRLFTTVNCNSNKTCPGPIGVVPNHYDTYTFENGESNACVTVTLSTACDLFSAAYLGSYSSTNFCQNYLSDMGNSTGTSGSNSYSFSVPARARFVVVVSEVDMGGCSYTLRVIGGSCRPSLKTFPTTGGNIVFDWSTSAVGYGLEKTNSISGGLHPLWIPATPAPVMMKGRLRVTNSAPGSQQFYQLRKP